MPPVSFSPIWQLVIALGLIEILTIRVHNDEFDSADAAGDHPVDNVVAGAADTDHFDIYDLICVSFRLDNLLLCIHCSGAARRT